MYHTLFNPQAAPAGNGYAGSDSYIDEWYEQSRIYNNPAYMDDWDSGSAHMTILGLDAEGKGKANGGMAMGGQNFTEVRLQIYKIQVVDYLTRFWLMT